MIASIQIGSFLWYLRLPHDVLVCYFGVTCLFYALSTMLYVNSISRDPKKGNINVITQSVKSQKITSHFNPSNTAHEHSGTKERERKIDVGNVSTNSCLYLFIKFIWHPCNYPNLN